MLRGCPGLGLAAVLSPCEDCERISDTVLEHVSCRNGHRLQTLQGCSARGMLRGIKWLVEQLLSMRREDLERRSFACQCKDHPRQVAIRVNQDIS